MSLHANDMPTAICKGMKVSLSLCTAWDPHALYKGMQATVSQANLLQAQIAERLQAEEKETEAALQKAQDQEVGAASLSPILLHWQASKPRKDLLIKVTYCREVAQAWPLGVARLLVS